MVRLTPRELTQRMLKRRSVLCVGLDPDPNKFPGAIERENDPVYTFCKEIVEATSPYAIAYKVNLAYFEQLGRGGWSTLWRLRDILPDNCLLIADAKRADIGPSSQAYAKALFEELNFHAVTVNPYMGADSVAPFIERAGAWTFLLSLTSNPGAADFQLVGEPPLWERVIALSQTWERTGELGYVVGATRAERLARVRKLAPRSWLLVPGVGTQGGDLEAVCRMGMVSLEDNIGGGLLVNASRSILYASDGNDFAEAAANVAEKLAKQMAEFVPSE